MFFNPLKSSFYLLFIFSFLVVSSVKGQQIKRQEVPQFSKILDSLNVEGSILIVDNNTQIAYSNDFVWANKKWIPASTFKIPNSIIALELKIVNDENTILKWDGKKRDRKIWEKDLTLKEAFQASCVPCFQEIASKIGYDRMKKYLTKLKYPGMVFDESNLTTFWLEGKSRISQNEEIDFIKRLYFSKLPISEKTEKTVKKIMEVEKAGSYTLSGKTGYGLREGNDVGWFVGYLEEGNHLYFFATNIGKKSDTKEGEFTSARVNATKAALKYLKFIRD